MQGLINLFLDGVIILSVCLLVGAFMLSGLWAMMCAGDGTEYDRTLKVIYKMSRVKRFLYWCWAFFVAASFIGGFIGLYKNEVIVYLRSLLP